MKEYTFTLIERTTVLKAGTVKAENEQEALQNIKENKNITIDRTDTMNIEHLRTVIDGYFVESRVGGMVIRSDIRPKW